MSDELNMLEDRRRFEEILPFYVTGKLPDADKAFMGSYIDTHPGLQSEVQFIQKLSCIVRSTGANRNTSATLRLLLDDEQNVYR
jgi:anti-sigma factor RsiW